MIRFEDIYETVRSHHPGRTSSSCARPTSSRQSSTKGRPRASGRALPRPSRWRWRPSWPRCAMDPACVAVGLLHDVLEDTLTEPDRINEYFGEDVLHIVEGVTKISKIPFSVVRGAPGGELPQAAPGHGRRRARHPGQAGRPPAQHAHPAVPARGPAGAHRPRDDGHLRPAGRPAGHGQDQERAGGPLVPVPGARGVQACCSRRVA